MRNWRMTGWGLACLLLMIVTNGLLISDAAAAQPSYMITVNDNFSCDKPDKIITDTQSFSNDEGVFGFVIKAYQIALYTAMAQGYCAIRNAVSGMLGAGMLIAVIIFAIAFTMGITKFSIREVMVLIFKISLVLMFAMNAQLAMSIVFKFFLGITTDSIGWLNSGVDLTSNDGQFKDFAAYFEDPKNKCAGQLLLFFTIITVLLPVLGAPLIMMLITFVMLFIRAVLGFLTALGAVSLLMAASPLFIAFALFKTTYGFFDRWLRSMISYSLQMVLVFFIIYACMGMFNFFDMFVHLEKSLAPAPVPTFFSPIFSSNFSAICMPCVGFSYNGDVGFGGYTCSNPGKETGMELSTLLTLSMKLYAPYILTNVIWLMILLWGVMEMITAAPMIAFALAGDSASMTLGGRVGRSEDTIGRDERHQFDMGGIDSRMDKFTTGFRFGYDPGYHMDVKNKIRESNPDYGKTQNSLFAPFERIGEGFKTGMAFANSDQPSSSEILRLLPTHMQMEAKYAPQQLTVEKNWQHLHATRVNLNVMKAQFDAGHITAELYEQTLTELEQAETEYQDSEYELEKVKSDYMRSLNVMDGNN